MELVVCGDKIDTGQRGDLGSDKRVEALRSVQAGTDRGAAERECFQFIFA